MSRAARVPRSCVPEPLPVSSAQLYPYEALAGTVTPLSMNVGKNR
jgi:hypothetical protein